MAERPSSYLSLLHSGELKRRARSLLSLLQDCRCCPRSCGADRLHDKPGTCRTGRRAEVASWCLHRGEEPCISGTRGSGTIFFAHCNLACIYCQNHDISQEWHPGEGALDADALAALYLDLQERGAHNINWVSPGHVVPQAVEALALAAERGFSIPVVYNSNGYDSLETLALLDGIVDIYMPDLKYADDDNAKALSGVEDYVAFARAAVVEMWRQVGSLRFDEEDVATHGLLVRHLVLPGDLGGTREVLSFLATALGPGVSVSLMAQYHPCHKASVHPVLKRPLEEDEYARAVADLQEAGLTLGYVQGLASSGQYLPHFLEKGHPFERE